MAVSDNFNRANANPAGGNWSAATASGGNPQIVSNTLAGNSGDQLFYWNADTFAQDHYAECTQGGAAQDSGPAVRIEPANAQLTGYAYDIEYKLLMKWSGGSFTTLGSVSDSVSTTAVYRLEATGSNPTTLKVYKDGVLFHTYEDATSPLTTGTRAGVFIYGTTAVDDWGAGNVGLAEITGTASITEAGDTVSATGTVGSTGVTGDASITEAADTLSATGTVASGGANHYVRSGATGTGSGNDWTNAYTDIPSTLTRGDTYYVAGGTYPAHTFSQAASGSLTITIKKATVADHGTSTGWSDSYGTTQAAWTGGWVVTSPYWVFDGVTGGGWLNGWSGGFGFKITETDSGTAMISLGTPGGSHQADNITISHVEFVGMGSESPNGGSYSNDGLAVYGNSNITLSYYHMHDIGRCPFFLSTGNFVAEHGYVQSFFAGATTHGEIMSTWDTLGDVTHRYTLFTDIQSTGGLMWDNAQTPTAEFRVYGNVFYKPAGATWDIANGVIGGWTGSADCSREQYKNAKIYNNTFINVDQDSLSALQACYANNTASNNLWYNCDSPNFAKYATHDYNHFINSGGSHSEANGTSAASGDPFTNYAGLDFTLASATSAGLTLSSPYNMDPAGVTRGADGTWDRGAFEFVAGEPGGITGSASITEASDTVSAAGAVAAAGAASITEAADTKTIAGTVAVAGAASITEASDTLSSSNASQITAGASITESADTVTAAGAVGVVASASIAESADTLASAGAATPVAPVIEGTLSKTGFVGVPLSYQITTYGGTPTSYGATGLPTGLSINTSTGLISGTVNTAQKATIAISATNAIGTGNADLEITITSAQKVVRPVKRHTRGIRSGDKIGH